MERVRCRRDVARCWPNLRCKQEDKNTTQHQFDFDQLHCYVIVVDDVNKVEGARCRLNVIQCGKTLRWLLCRCIQDVWCKQDIKKRCKICFAMFMMSMNVINDVQRKGQYDRNTKTILITHPKLNKPRNVGFIKIVKRINSSQYLLWSSVSF